MKTDPDRIPEKVLVIGLDGFTFDLIEPLARRSLMPTLTSIMENGFHCTLRSTVPPLSAPAWVTLMTGMNPGKHGIIHFETLKPDEGIFNRNQQLRGVELAPGVFSLLNANSIRTATLWQILSNAGKRIGIINVPMTYPPSPVNGFMITGMMTPPGSRDFTYPANLVAELFDYEIEASIAEKEFSTEPSLMILKHYELLEKRAATTLRLMSERAWDFFMVVFTGTDRILHRFWKYIVPTSVDYNSVQAQDLRPQLDAYFTRLDQVVSELVSTARNDTTTIVLSDHGFGPISELTVFKQSLMRELELNQGSARRLIPRLRYLLEGEIGLTSVKIRRFVSSIIPRQLVSRLEARVRCAERQGWLKDEAYLVTLQNFYGGIYLNLRWLQEHASLPLDSAVEAIRNEIIEKLRKLKDPESGDPLVSDIYTREQLFKGEYTSDFPDIVFRISPDYGLSGGPGPRGALVGARRADPEKQGTHKEDGILMMIGPGIRTGRSGTQALIDVTATILYLIGVPIPSDFDSQVIHEALSPSLLADRPVTWASAREIAQPDSTSEYTEEEAEAIRERLRDLGYLD